MRDSNKLARRHGETILDLAITLQRLLASAVGVGNHYLYFRPLWDPQDYTVERSTWSDCSQLIGFKFFDINRYVPHLIDISHVTFIVDVTVHKGFDEWFLDFSNPAGESIVWGSESINAIQVTVNDAALDCQNFPYFYDAVRRREYFWRWYDANHTSYRDIVDFVRSYDDDTEKSTELHSLCESLGLLRKGRRTLSGKSLIGERPGRKCDGV